MFGVMRMTIGHLRQQTPQSGQKIKIGSRVQVGCRERTGCVRGKDDTHAAFSLRFPQICCHRFRYVNHLIFFVCSDSDGFHLLSFTENVLAFSFVYVRIASAHIINNAGNKIASTKTVMLLEQKD
jgi:hypothetical protein